MVEGQEQLASEKWLRAIKMHMHVHTHMQRRLTKALICRLNVGRSFLLAAALLSFCQHVNIYLKGAVD